MDSVTLSPHPNKRTREQANIELSPLISTPVSKEVKINSRSKRTESNIEEESKDY